MADEPPVALVELLSKLRLATPEQVQSVRGRARKLASELPLFDSVWIDALAQARLLTPWQAAEINAGRGEQLQVGPYVLRRRIQRFGNAELILAAVPGEVDKEKKDRPEPMVHLAVARGVSGAEAEQAATKLAALARVFSSGKRKGLARLLAASSGDGVVWGAYEPATGFAVADWLSCQGRFSPAAALEIARQMATALAALEKDGHLHGDISASSTWLTDAGEVQLIRCGFRSALGGGGGAQKKSAAEELDYLAPELVGKVEQADGDALTAQDYSVAAEIYACGILLWQLLAGRTPIAGGDYEHKCIAAREAKIPDIRRIAPDVSAALANVIERCTQREPVLRPQRFGEVADLLGSSTGTGRRILSLELFDSGRWANRGNLPRKIRSSVRGAGQPLVAATVCALLLCAATWPLWRPRHSAIERGAASAPVVENRVRPRPSVLNALGIFERRGSGSKPGVPQRGTTDGEVRPASFQVSTEATTASKTANKSVAEPLARTVIELESGEEVSGGKLRLQAGAIVRGKDGERVRIATPPTGLAVTVDRVRFENIDFVWRQRAEEIVSPERSALVDLKVGQTEFVGCTFQAEAAGSYDLPAAIRLGSSSRGGARLQPAVGVQLERCVISGVGCGVDCITRGPAAISARDTLCLVRGALVRFSQMRRADAVTNVTLEHVCIRGAAAMMEVNCDDAADAMGTIAVNTTGCVFAPEENGGLVIFSGRSSPKVTGGMITALDWTCQDSLVTPATNVAVWSHEQSREKLPDDQLALEGLVASEFEFMGAATNMPSDSRLKRWLAPMRTEQVPGIDEGLPQLPELKHTAGPATENQGNSAPAG